MNRIGASLIRKFTGLWAGYLTWGLDALPFLPTCQAPTRQKLLNALIVKELRSVALQVKAYVNKMSIRYVI